MASSFSQQGATPKQTLSNIGNKVFGNTNQGLVGSLSRGLGFQNTPPVSSGLDNSPPGTPGGYDRARGVTPGLIQPKPATPLKKSTTTNVDGSSTTHEYHAPQTNTSGTNTASAPVQNTTVPLNTNPQVGNQQQNAQNVLDASNLNNNPEYQMLNKQNNQLVQAQNSASTAPFAGSQQNLGQSYADLAHPQSTGNLAGELANFNNQSGIQIAGNTAERAGLLAGAQLGTQGATSVLSAGQPQYGVQPGTLVGQPFQPNGGIDQNYLGGIAAPANIRSVQDFTTQVNTTQKSIDTLHNFANTIIPNMGTTGFNQAATPIGNQTFEQYFANSNPAASAGIKAGLGEIKNQISNVVASATGLTPTGVTAITDSYDLTKLNPQQLNDFLLYIDKYAKMNIDAANKSIDRIKNGGRADSDTGRLPIPAPNTTGDATLGTGATAAQGLITKILNSAGSAVAGGIAAKVLL